MTAILTAKKVAENALKAVGAFPASQSSPDPGDMRTALQWLEMMLNSKSGTRPLAGFWDIIDIPIEQGVGDYLLSDYTTDAQIQHVFSVNIVDGNGNVDPLDVIWENQSVLENFTDTGRPTRAVITKSARPMLKIYPTPTQTDEDNGSKIRLRVQTFHSEIDETGIADSELMLRPSWNLWITKWLSYEIGCGPVRRLAEFELKRFQTDYIMLESELLARDGLYNSARPRVTEPMPGA